MIFFYKNYFFPAEHVDAGKPIPFGLRGQFGGRPRLLEQYGVEYKLAMLEFDLKGYSHIVRNGDDPLQERLRTENYLEMDERTFEELYRIGLERVGLTAAPRPAGFLPMVAGCAQQAMELVAVVNNFKQEHPKLYAVAKEAVSVAGVLFSNVKQ